MSERLAVEIKALQSAQETCSHKRFYRASKRPVVNKRFYRASERPVVTYRHPPILKGSTERPRDLWSRDKGSTERPRDL